MAQFPLIGISANPAECDNPDRDDEILRYCDAVAKAGGAPVILPFIADPSPLVDKIAAWLIAGGKDIDPAEYGQEAVPETEPILRRRYDFEKTFWPLFVQTGKPILGICYGAQFINVRHGGTLVQHIPSERPDAMNHASVNKVAPIHDVELGAGSLAARACGSTRFPSASSHHQALGEIGDGLRLTGHAPDGIPEAIERSDRWMLGLQWHPEKTPDAPESLAVMRAFVDEAAGR